MSNIEDIVDSLENKISKVLHKLESLKQANSKLQEALQASEMKLQEQDNQMESWEEKYEALKMAKTILGSDDNKRETKLKINTLIRDIDHCISQISE